MDTIVKICTITDTFLLKCNNLFKQLKEKKKTLIFAYIKITKSLCFALFYNFIIEILFGIAFRKCCLLEFETTNWIQFAFQFSRAII